MAFELLSSWIVESGAAPHPPLSPEYRGEGKKLDRFEFTCPPCGGHGTPTSNQLRQNPLDHIPMHVGQAHVAAAEAVGEAFVVHT